MDQKSSFLHYAVTVGRRSFASFSGADTGFAVAAYLAVIILAALKIPLLQEFLNDAIETLLAYCAIIWLLALLFIVTPYRIIREQADEIGSLKNQGLADVETPIWRAIHYVSLAINEKYSNECWPMARLAIREAALAGKIRIRGRVRIPGGGLGSAVHTPIEPKHWRQYEIDPMATSPEYVESYHTKQESGGEGGDHWSLLVDMREVRANWPVGTADTIAAGEAVRALALATQISEDAARQRLRDLASTRQVRTWGRKAPEAAIPLDFEALEEIPAGTWLYARIDESSTDGPLPTNSLRYLDGKQNDGGQLYEAVRFNRHEIVNLCLAASTSP